MMPERHFSMTDHDTEFFKTLGARVAEFRKGLALTQTDLAQALGITQPMVASYEIGRRRIPASLIVPLAKKLHVSVPVLLGEEEENGKRGPVPKLQKQIDAVAGLPKSKQEFVSQFLETVLSQAG
jgi:transcriptional regulator with XRE-family HTH domain